MKSFFQVLIFTLLPTLLFGQTKLIHVYVALCDNEHQGIVPVPKSIGDGKNPRTNLYWGAGYGVKNFFKVKTADWELVKQYPQPTRIYWKGYFSSTPNKMHTYWQMLTMENK